MQITAVLIEALGIDWLLRCKNCSGQDRLLGLRQQVAVIGVLSFVFERLDFRLLC
jgi:hypothetical protein